MFSKTCEYAIRAMIFIAQKSKAGEKVSVRDVAKGIGSPEYFIAKILQQLCREGLLLSSKGPAGGFFHNERSLKHSIADIVHVIDGDKIFNGCGLGLKQCSESRPCPIHHEFKKCRDSIRIMLENTQLDEFAESLDKKLSYLRR